MARRRVTAQLLGGGGSGAILSRRGASLRTDNTGGIEKAVWPTSIDKLTSAAAPQAAMRGQCASP
jgi:hypothetical protein